MSCFYRSLLTILVLRIRGNELLTPAFGMRNEWTTRGIPVDLISVYYQQWDGVRGNFKVEDVFLNLLGRIYFI